MMKKSCVPGIFELGNLLVAMAVVVAHVQDSLHNIMASSWLNKSKLCKLILVYVEFYYFSFIYFDHSFVFLVAGTLCT